MARTKLNYEEALSIVLKTMSGEHDAKIAKEHDMSRSMIREIRHGRAWKDAYSKAHVKVIKFKETI